MKALILGAGLMGRAIAFDLNKYSNFDKLTVVDSNKKSLRQTEMFLKNSIVTLDELDVKDKDDIKRRFKKTDVVISAIPYNYNYELSKLAINTKTHFIDLGGNNNIVNKQRSLFEKAKKQNVTIIADCGLAPGLVSIITKEIVEELDYVDFVKLRVGGLPLHPKPPLNYQIVFSPNGLINEYLEDAIILDKGNIVNKKSMSGLEKIKFPKPFVEMEAFFTSGGCSTLPFTYKDKINYLDYKTIRYKGHCEKFKILLDLGFGSQKEIKIENTKIIPRKLLIELLLKNLPTKGKDVVLLKVFGKGSKDSKKCKYKYTMVDYYDDQNNISAMMRTTGYPVSITAQMIENKSIKDRGVFCPEEIMPTKKFLDELIKRNIIIKKIVEN